MVYNSFNFIIFFPLIFLLYYFIPAKYQRIRNIYLLIVSYSLYMAWEPVYALILLGITMVSYYSAIQIGKSPNRKSILMTGIIFSIIPLLLFKYFHFLNKVICDLLSSTDFRIELVGLNWAIPMGISFYTFQALGYLWDVYYKKIEAEEDFLIFALFLSFFPSILSGPINKASLVIPQLKNLRPYFDGIKATGGLKMLLWGMFMKVVVADRVALYVDTVFSNYMNYTGISCFAASLLYSVQIYADFAGYSLMAIGVGKTLGFELTNNFLRPYFAYSVTDFWRRWHISLSIWLRDYIYFPLGGSHCGKIRNYWNIFVTFLVSGIWHGANWTFIVWGVCHAFFQIMEKAVGQQMCNYGIIGRSLKICITFLLVNFAWIFFKMPSLTDALNVIGRIFDSNLPMTLFFSDLPTICFIILGCSLLFIKDFRDEFFPKRLQLMNSNNFVVRWTTYLTLIVTILLTGIFSTDQFIYANF